MIKLIKGESILHSWRSLRVWNVGGLISGRVKSKTEHLTVVASLASVQYLLPRARLVDRCQYLTSVC